MRACLDRAVQDPEKRRTRLGAIARDLIGARAAPELGLDLVTRICDAVGGTGCCLLLERPTAWPLISVGDVSPLPAEQQRAEVSTTGKLLVVGKCVLIPIRGLNDTIGALWLRLERPLDADTLRLLQALADTVGIVLEQGLSEEAPSTPI